jgi:hypothetical protein
MLELVHTIDLLSVVLEGVIFKVRLALEIGSGDGGGGHVGHHSSHIYNHIQQLRYGL